MIRFILNFIGFGILFYVIYLFFPEGFKTLVSWADQLYEFLRGIVSQVENKIHTTTESQAPTHTATIPFYFVLEKLF